MTGTGGSISSLAALSVREWFTPAEIVAAGSPDLPGTIQAFNRMAVTFGWRADADRARSRAGGWEYHLSVLPPAAQARLVLIHRVGANEPEPVHDASKALWERFKGLSSAQKAECQRRFDALLVAEEAARGGMGETAAAVVAALRSGTSTATIFNWKKMVRGVARADWLAALAPDYKPTAVHAECHPKAWDILVSDWLRPGEPRFSACYRRMRKAASEKGWLPIPPERTLRRRLEREIPRGVAVLAREGKDKAKTLYPAQRRTRINLHAMQAVNMDGHKFDVFVRFPNGTISRPCLVAIQDLYSNKFVAWRHAETENKVSVRLAIGDMVERHGIPDKMVFDNGRAFASKWISGGTANRFRFKVRDEEPQGLLTTLGVEIHWTTPYSGQSKPIERAFRDFCEDIAKHPFCDGAYTGNRPDAKPENYASRAIPFDAFCAFVDEQIADHNARPDRSTETAVGRSFDETFAASLAQPSSIVRWPTEAQKSLWLLTAERVTARKGSGEIHLFENRYWAPALNSYAGKKLTVRFDPDRLQAPITVYDLDDSFICEAACIADVGFFDADEAQRHARSRKSLEKANRDLLAIHRKLSADELGALYGAGDKHRAPAPIPPKVKRLAVGGGRAAAAAEPVADFEESFSRGLSLLEGDADIIPFTPRRSEDG